MSDIKIIGLSLFAIFLTHSCSDEGAPSRVPKTVSTVADAIAGASSCLSLATVPTSWTGGIATIFQSKCGSCHPGSMPTNYTMYYDVTTNISTIMMRIDAGTMPTGGPLAVADKAAIHAWITAGMPEVDGAAAGNGSTTTSTSGSSTVPTSCPVTTAQTTPSTTPTTNPSTTPVIPIVVAPLEPTYARGVKQIMSAYCVGCHSAAGGTGPYLDTYDSVVANYSNVRAQIIGGGMPVPKTATSKLPADKIDIVTKWGSNPNAPYGKFAP